jgi:signal transduction histidine kinase
VSAFPSNRSTTEVCPRSPNELEAEIKQFKAELMKANESLRQGEERWRLAMAAGRMVSWDWEISTGRVILSQDWEALHGIPPGTFAGTFDAYLSDIHPGDREVVMHSIRTAVDQGADHHAEYRLVWPEGSIHWIEARGKVLRDESGQPARMIGVCMDINERKQVEQSFAMLYAQVREADRHKDEFLAMLAHELRNPMAPIRNGIDVLRFLPPNGEQAKQILGMLEEQAHNLDRLIDDLLDVSRCGQGKLELRRQRVALSKIITNAIQTAEPLIRASGHELSVTQERENVHLYGDPTRLTQIVSNLLNNAAKYTPRRGKILLTTERSGDEVVIKVKDNGSGIASEMLPRIFEMFVQADNSLNRAHGGLGIGLTLVKSFVEMHGGAINATSDGMGKGSEFAVRLPLLNADDVACEEAKDSEEPPKSFPCHRILIVDDLRPAAYIVATLLRSFGQQVCTAENGAEALAVMEREKPDLVLSDISMPEMTGHELAREIRRRPEWNDVSLVAVTGYGQESDKNAALDAGFNSHVVKPIRKEDLERLLLSLAYLR